MWQVASRGARQAFHVLGALRARKPHPMQPRCSVSKVPPWHQPVLNQQAGQRLPICLSANVTLMQGTWASEISRWRKTKFLNIRPHVCRHVAAVPALVVPSAFMPLTTIVLTMWGVWGPHELQRVLAILIAQLPQTSSPCGGLGPSRTAAHASHAHCSTRAGSGSLRVAA